MVNLYVGITDYDWFRFFSALPGIDEVNFWQPGGRTNFQALRPGELFLFKLPCTSKLHCWWRGLRASRHPSDLAGLGSFRRKQWGTVAG